MTHENEAVLSADSSDELITERLIDCLEAVGISPQFATQPEQMSQLKLALIDLNKHADVPCFVVAPRKLGRSTFVRIYAQLFYCSKEVQWLDGSKSYFSDNLDRGTLFAHLKHQRQTPNCERKLMIVDDLAFLDDGLAECLSDKLDDLVEQGWQVIVITVPQNDCYQSLQSDRHLLDMTSLLQTRSFTQDERCTCVSSFLSEGLPIEMRLFAMLTVLAGHVSLSEAAALGVTVHSDVPLNIANLHSFFQIQAGGKGLSTVLLPLASLVKDICCILEEYLQFGVSVMLETDVVRRKALELITNVSILLLQRGEHQRSREIINFAEDHLLTPVTLHAAQLPLGEEASEGSMRASGADLTHHERPLVDPNQILHIRLFGGLEIYRGQDYLQNNSLRSSRLRQLLVHLALSFGRGISQDTIIERYWPKRPESRGYENLYVLWSRLARVLSESTSRECPYLVRNAGILKLNEHLVQVDTHRFEEQARIMLTSTITDSERIALVQAAESLYGSGLVFDKYSDIYFRGYAERLKALYVDVMLEGARLFEAEGNHATALWMARKAYESDDSKEEVYRALMDAQIKAGRRTSAMQTYFACKNFLSEELGVLPSQLTTNLYQELIMDKG